MIIPPYKSGFQILPEPLVSVKVTISSVSHWKEAYRTTLYGIAVEHADDGYSRREICTVSACSQDGLNSFSRWHQRTPQFKRWGV